MGNRTAWTSLALSLAATPVAAQDVAGVPVVRVMPIGVKRDPGILRMVQRFPRVSTAQWDGEGYPPAAIAARDGGSVMVEVAVSADDRITSCTVIPNESIPTSTLRPIGRNEKIAPALTDAACPLILRRGGFRHALRADGTPVAGIARLIVSFGFQNPDGGAASPPAARPAQILPEQGLKGGARPVLRGVSPADFPARPLASIMISETGEPTGCFIVESAGTDAGDRALCRYAMTLEYAPALDAVGKPMPWSVSLSPEIVP